MRLYASHECSCSPLHLGIEENFTIDSPSPAALWSDALTLSNGVCVPSPQSGSQCQRGEESRFDLATFMQGHASDFLLREGFVLTVDIVYETFDNICGQSTTQVFSATTCKKPSQVLHTCHTEMSEL